jgi:hypothetical protein
MANKVKDLLGQQFGRLTVIARAGKASSGHVEWLCECSCGKQKTVNGSYLSAGKILSCGCLASDSVSARNFKHGHAKRKAHSLEYSTWHAMLDRCYYEGSIGYHNYGGRGIGVCDRWRESFEAFLEDMGKRLSKKYSIERIDNEKGYEPGNCRWATDKEQANNTRYNHRLTFNGETLSMTLMWEKYGQGRVSKSAFANRIHRGLSVKEALAGPYKIT